MAPARTPCRAAQADLAIVALTVAPCMDEGDPFISEGAIALLTRLEPTDLARYAEQLRCACFDEQPEVRAAAQRAMDKLRAQGRAAPQAIAATPEPGEHRIEDGDGTLTVAPIG